MLKRADKFHPWSVLKSTVQSGRGFAQARVAHAHQYTLGSIYNQLGYHVVRRRQFKLRGMLRDSAVSVLNVASDQFGVWNVSGYPLSVFLVLPNTSELHNTTVEKAKRAPLDGAGMPRELDLVQRQGFGAVLTSNLGHKAADVYSAWPAKDHEAALLVATFKNGTAHLWTTRSVKRGTCLVLLPGCVKGNNPTAFRSCAEHDFQATILALHAAGNSRLDERRDAPDSTSPSTPSMETGK